MPSGAVKNTIARREKLCIWIISSVSMAKIMTGKSTKIELLPFCDSSIAPPISMRDAGGRQSRIECELWPQGPRDVRRLHAVDDVGAAP